MSLSERFNNFIYRTLTKVEKDLTSKRYLTILLLIVFGLIAWRFSWESAILWVVFLAFLIYRWESRILAGAALVFLAICPFYLYYQYNDIAEQMAIYAYLFLVMFIVLEIIDFVRSKK